MSVPRRAMILAAGRGRRMRPVSGSVPKPLIEIGGRSMLDRMLDRFAGFDGVAVNAWHLADRVERAVARRADPPVTLFRETTLLDTGGGVLNALSWLGGEPFVVANGDILLSEPRTPAVRSLGAAWDRARMDALLLLVPRERAAGFRGAGDFLADGEGRLARRGGARRAPFVYAGMQIVSPGLFDDAPAPPFSFNVLWDRAIAAGRLYGAVHDGGWFTVDTPAAIARGEAWLAGRP